MSDSPILFSIVVPTYNRAHLLPATIESILSQGYKNYEVIIVDDGSTDDTEDVVRIYLSDRFLYYKKENGERAAARNFGTLKAKGDYINWLDSDDIMFPDCLQTAANFLINHHHPEVLAQGYQFQSSAGVVLRIVHYPDDINGILYKGNLLSNSPVIVRRDIALANLFNDDRELSGSEDYELWLRLASKYKIFSSPKMTVAVVDHNERSTLTMSDPGQLIRRFTKFIHYTISDDGVIALLGKNKGFFLMKNYLILAVSLVNCKEFSLSRKYLAMAFSNSLKLIFQRGFYGFIKHYCLNKLH